MNYIEKRIKERILNDNEGDIACYIIDGKLRVFLDGGEWIDYIPDEFFIGKVVYQKEYKFQSGNKIIVDPELMEKLWQKLTKPKVESTEFDDVTLNVKKVTKKDRETIEKYRQARKK